jgi:hypothetical protein
VPATDFLTYISMIAFLFLNIPFSKETKMDFQFKELEDAVCEIIDIMQQKPELVDTKLLVIGGLALWHYLPNRRPTNVRP